MDTRDQAAFLALMMQMGTLYHQAVQEFLVEIYWVALERFDLASVKQALQAHVNHPDTGQYMPKPADLVRFLEGSRRTRALLAWSRVAKAIREIGSYTSVVFDDALIHAVVRDMGGWVKLCEGTVAELPFLGHDFQARYVGYVEHPPGQYPQQLTGRLGQDLSTAQSSQGCVLIGDGRKALQVYQQGQRVGQPNAYSTLPALEAMNEDT